MNSETVLIFAAYGMGDADGELRLKLARIFLELISSSGLKPGKICFYTEGVRLACEGSPVLDSLLTLQQAGVELVLCKTCLDYYAMTGRVRAGVIGGMPDIIEAMSKAQKVIRL